MNDSIEKLQLDISITGNIKESIANVEALATAISHLNAKVQELEVKGFDVKSVTAFDGNLKKVAQTTKVVTEELTDAQKRYNELASLFTSNKISNEQYKEFSKLAEEFGKMEKGYAGLVLPTGELIQPKQRKLKVGDSQQKTPKVPTDLDLSKINSQLDIYIAKLKLVQEALKDESITTEKALSLKQQEYTLKEKIAKEQEKANKNDDKSEKSKFIAQTKRIALYRLIRYVLKEITKSVQETASEISKISPEFNKTLSQTTSSLQVLKGSVGVFANSLLPIIEPILKSVSVAVGNIANALSGLNATLSGQGEYIKVNTEYLKDYQSTINGTLLSFDTFNTLSANKNNKDGLFSTEIIENFSKDLDKVKDTLILILGTLTAIETLKLIEWINKGGIKEIAKNLGSIKDGLGSIEGVSLAVASSMAWIMSLTNLLEVLSNWKSSNFVTQLTAILGVISGIAAVIFTIISLTTKGEAKVAKAIAFGATAASTIFTVASSYASRFENGGMFEGAGTMYAIAGESGAEIVAKGSQGTGVANVEQISDAMYLALVKYGVAKGNLNNASISLDGQKVGKLTANSSYREMVRQGLI